MGYRAGLSRHQRSSFRHRYERSPHRGSATARQVVSPERLRDRSLLGAAGESLGMDRHLKVNTAKRRTHSLFRQGCMLYELIPNMPEARLRPLIARFRELITQNKALTQTFAFV